MPRNCAVKIGAEEFLAVSGEGNAFTQATSERLLGCASNKLYEITCANPTSLDNVETSFRDEMMSTSPFTIPAFVIPTAYKGEPHNCTMAEVIDGDCNTCKEDTTTTAPDTTAAPVKAGASSLKGKVIVGMMAAILTAMAMM